MVAKNFFNHFRLLSILVGLTVTASCSYNKQEEISEQKFPVTNPIVTDTLYTSDYVADIQSVQNVEIRARVSGYLDRILVDEGRAVKKGELLFSIGGQEYREELMKAKAMLKSAIADAKSAEVELLSVERLVEKNIVSKSEIDIARSTRLT